MGALTVPDRERSMCPFGHERLFERSWMTVGNLSRTDRWPRRGDRQPSTHRGRQ